MKPDQRIFVGAFHKTGNVLMADIFRRVAKQLNLVFWQPRGAFAETEGGVTPPFNFDICHDGHSRFLSDEVLFSGDLRCVISIRDPRDVIISSARYHVHSHEKWLHIPMAQFGGRTYQQAIAALPNEDERFLFEMDNAARTTIRRMLAVDRQDERITVTRLDRLIVDYELQEYRRLFSFLGFGADALEACLNIARARSIFSRGILPKHVHHTMPALWKEQFTPALAAAFEDRFAGAAELLGYEPTFITETA